MRTYCVFLTLFATAVGFAPTLLSTRKRTALPIRHSSQPNFEDSAVECSSEGGKWSEGMSQEFLPLPPLSAATVGELWADSFALAVELWGLPATAVSIVQLCDRIDAATPRTRAMGLLRLRRQTLLTAMLKESREMYLETVKFLAGRLPREDLPNWQDVPYFMDGRPADGASAAPAAAVASSVDLISDCALPNVTYSESPLDQVLLYIFRDLVRKEIQWRSETPGIRGLLEEGRHYMLSPAGAVTENQHAFVRRTLGALLTPVLPPFYRLFMAGIVPSEARGDPKWLASGAEYVVEQVRALPVVGDSRWVQDNLVPGKQIGPWFYAPLLTSVVTPPFLSFLVGTHRCRPAAPVPVPHLLSPTLLSSGPSRINRRKDGQVGGMVVEKCKFLQESGCKGLCLHQCKLPAQQFFKDTLGLPLTVSPDFATQSCQWSWGEEPLPPEADPSFPKGCLSACPTRSELRLAVASGATDASSAASNSLCNA